MALLRIIIFVFFASGALHAESAMEGVFGGKKGSGIHGLSSWSDTKTDTKTDTETKSEPEVKPEASSEPEVKAEPEAKPEAKPEPKPETKPEPKKKSEPKKTKSKPKAKPKVEAKPEPKPKAEPKSETKLEPQPEAKPAPIHSVKSSSVFGKTQTTSAVTSSEARSKSYSVFGGKRGQKKAVEPEPTDKTVGKTTGVVEENKYANDNPRSAPKFLWPVAGGRISSFYGWRNSKRFHDGIDIIANAGTKVFASKGGEVIYSDSRIRGYGNMIVIRGNESLNTVYAHLKTSLVKKGDIVSQGDLIGYVGNTGHSTGPHLHFEIRKGKYTADPLKYLSDKDVKLHSGAYKDTDVGLKDKGD